MILPFNSSSGTFVPRVINKKINQDNGNCNIEKSHLNDSPTFVSLYGDRLLQQHIHKCLISLYTSTENWEGNSSITGCLHHAFDKTSNIFAITIYGKFIYQQYIHMGYFQPCSVTSRFLSLYNPVIVRLKIETDVTNTIFAKI